VAAKPDVPSAPAIEEPESAAAAPEEPAPGAAPQRAPVRVHTDVVYAEIDPLGATLTRLELLEYPVSTERPNVPFRLLDGTPPDVFVAQSGLLGTAAGVPSPDHHAQFTAPSREYRLADGAETLEVRLVWQSPEGVEVSKIYTFTRGSYAIDVSFVVDNRSGEPWTGRMYAQFSRAPPVSENRGLFRTYTYTGGVVSGPEKPYEKIDFSDMEETDLERSVTGGWAAMIQHYFAGAWVPDQSAQNYFYTKAVGDGRYVIGVITPEIAVPPAARGETELTLYAGPKIQKRLDKIAPHLERTVDYGWLWVISEPLFWLLDWIHGFVGNWGWSIILLTCLIKLVFFHLSATSYKSMAKMRKLQPRITALRDRYSGDRQRMNQAMMELYKKEKINPLGGCLPILVQIPVFIALYWVLLESVELRQAPFILWINDLSEHDPYFALPLMMGATMFLQQKLNPTPPDPVQAKIMMALPFVFTFFFLFFPSGLVLYWFVNNLLSIAQQWVITKKIVGPQGG